MRSTWTKQPPTFAGARVDADKAVLGGAERWAFLQSADEYDHHELQTTFTIQEPAKQVRFFGESWSAWPDPNGS